MIVLGLCDNHEAGAALAVDGRIVSAVNEERLNREKLSARFPVQSIGWVLQDQGLTPRDVDKIVVASTVTPMLLFRIFKDWHERTKQTADQFSFLLNFYILHQVLGRFFRLPMIVEAFLSKRLLKWRLARLGFNCPVEMIDHHYAHALAAYLGSGLERCLTVTADAMGDGLTLTVSIGENGGVRRIFAQNGFCAINTHYSRVTQFLGFTANRHEGKVVGLAAHGDPQVLAKEFNQELHFNGHGGFNLTPYWLPQSPDRGFYAKLRGHSRQDVAAALQDNLDREMVRFLDYWVERTGIRSVAFSGGLFANVKLNQRLFNRCKLDEIYIMPNMGDGGLCAGAALHPHHAPEGQSTSMFLGPEYTDREIETALKEADLAYEKPDDLVGRIAGLLADKKVVARFCGRMEFGPRALGHRSILYRTDDPTVMDWLNEKLSRTEFMPFAPVTLIEKAAECYLNTAGTERTWRYMNLCYDCTERMITESPGAVHVDGTARPQVIDREAYPGLYEILKKYYELTGACSILNTSFNLHEEPIVNNPRQAIQSYQTAELDALAIGPYLVVRS